MGAIWSPTSSWGTRRRRRRVVCIELLGESGSVVGLDARGRAVRFPCEPVEHVREGGVHVGHLSGYGAPEMEVEEHRGDGQQEAAAGGDQRFPDSFGEVGGLCAACGERAKTVDHTGYRPEQSDHGSQNGERVEVVDRNHETGFGAETFIGQSVFHGGFVVHVALIVSFNERVGEALSERTGVGLAVRVGFV